MITKQRTIAICIAVMILATTACRLGQAITPPAPASTNTPILPTATSTNTPIPPVPTVVVIQGSNDPIVIGDFNLSISNVDINERGYNGMAPYPMTADQTVLAVEITLISGDLAELSSWTLWVNDGQGNRTDSGATLSVDSKNQVVWLFPVAKTSDSFILHFPSGEIIALAPLLP